VPEHCAVVLDVGKTHAKLTLWNRHGVLIESRSRPNAGVEGRDYRALDTAGIESWVAETLADFARLGNVGAIVPVGHGAAAAILRGGQLACAPVDYEQPIPAPIRTQYDELRDQFRHTGSPALPDGLNLGAQLYWLESLLPDVLRGDAIIVPWAQYWAWVLSGVVASEVTSLGCHTDLWRPTEGRPSTLAVARGWDARLAPLRRADEVLGTLRPAWVSRTGLPTDTRVLCGLHDSNAALLAARGFAEIAEQEATVVSTGTWFVAMRSPAIAVPSVCAGLPERRDCLINVDVHGKPIPSARFMGGRELESLLADSGGHVDDPTEQSRLVDAVGRVVRSGAMVLPTLAPGVGPFPHARHRWLIEAQHSDARGAAACLYAALVLDAALDLIGTCERILVEGRFAAAEAFVRALARLRPGTAVYASPAHNGVPYGALRLLDPTLPPPGSLQRVEPIDADLSAYRLTWRREAERLESAA